MYVCMYVCMYHIIHKPLYPHAPWMIYIYIYILIYLEASDRIVAQAFFWGRGSGLLLATTHVICFLPCLVLAHIAFAFIHWMQVPAAARPKAAFRRLHADLKRRSVCEHAEGALLAPTLQFWYEPSLEIIWWDLDLLYQSERQHCARLQKRCHWLIEFQARVEADIPVPDDAPPFLLKENTDKNTVPTTS